MGPCPPFAVSHPTIPTRRADSSSTTPIQLNETVTKKATGPEKDSPQDRQVHLTKTATTENPTETAGPGRDRRYDSDPQVVDLTRPRRARLRRSSLAQTWTFRIASPPSPPGAPALVVSDWLLEVLRVLCTLRVVLSAAAAAATFCCCGLWLRPSLERVAHEPMRYEL